MGMYVERKRIIIFGVLPNSILNFRLDLIESLIRSGNEVQVIVAQPSIEFMQKINIYGVKVHVINLERRSYSFFNLLSSLIKFLTIIKTEKPNLVISYTIKPILISSIIRFFNGTFRLIVLFEGLGSVFDSGSFLKFLVKNAVIRVYRLFVNSADSVVFLNRENKEFFKKIRICGFSKSFVLDGIGINTSRFEFSNINISNGLVFLFIARLIKEKGVYEFLTASKILKKKYPSLEFLILGPSEGSGELVNMVMDYHNLGIVNYLGEVEDVRSQIIKSSVFVLPTYYNEGLPRTILESMAIGRPIVTTKVPGCNQTVVEGENGFFVNIGDSGNLVDVMERFVYNPALIFSMGKKSRELVESRFTSDVINHIFTTKIINPLL